MIKNKSIVENKIKIHFLITSILFLIATLGFSVFILASQFANSNSTSEEMYYLGSSLGIPLLTVIISYLILPKTYNKLDAAFWTVVLSFIGLLLFVTFNQLMIVFPLFQQSFYQSAGFYKDQIMLMALSYLPTALYFGYIYKTFQSKPAKAKVVNKK